ncbi:MAG TPA: GNAT family N-acetyltransferase [Gemmatimonadaceae bacterium]|nr:GNAT family N-acetyltransferase [Gemmatimonadaceae bacterium]
MPLEITEESAASLASYAQVPIAFEVRTVLDVVDSDHGLGGLTLTPRMLDVPYVKDYDADPAHHPLRWAERFDLSTWGFLAARVDGERVGGAAIAFGGTGMDMFEGRRDLAVLWDLRVTPAMRGKGIGAALFKAAEEWARLHGTRWLKVETQNINAGACRFYARQGCTLGGIHRFAYPELPHEAQLLWYKELGIRERPMASRPR